MPAEYRNPNGTLSQGYYCMTCGQTCNMLATGHGLGKCTPNPELVKQLQAANSHPWPRFRVKAKSQRVE